MTKPAPPRGLSRRSAGLWRDVMSNFVLSASEIMVLTEACASLDRAAAAAVVLDAEGAISSDRYGSPKAHPAVDIELRHRALAARLLASLGVEEPQATGGYGRHTPGPRRRAASKRKA